MTPIEQNYWEFRLLLDAIALRILPDRFLSFKPNLLIWIATIKT
jgi:hypothetical protein